MISVHCSKKESQLLLIDLIKSLHYILIIKYMIVGIFNISRAFSITNKKLKLFPHMTKKQQPAPKIYPLQYPKVLRDQNTSLIHKGRPIKYVTKIDEVPSYMDTPQDILALRAKKQQIENSYSLKIGILGPTNSGKSSIMASLTGTKISAVSAKAHTTSQIVTAVKEYQVNTELMFKNVQLVYEDTPGIFDNKGGFLTKGWSIMQEIDFALLVVDSNKRFQDSVRVGIERMERHNNSQAVLKALVLNKVDLVDSKRRFRTLISQIQKYGKFDHIFYTSATTGYGIQPLEQYLVSMAKKAQWQYPKGTKMTLTEREWFQQLMKEAIFNRTYEEVPHDIAIQCIGVILMSDENLLIRFRIGVNSQNQQRMLIGLKGKNIEAIKNHFLVQYAKSKKSIPRIEVQVSQMNKTKKKFNQITTNIFPQDYAIKKSESDVEELQKKLKKKFSTL